MEKNTAILAVSFGTTHMDTLERCIAATERAVAEGFRGYPVYRAFLSAMVMGRLKEQHGLQVDNVGETLARIEGDGYGQVAIQPTLLLRGYEYELLAKETEKAGIRGAIGRPLLEDARDCAALASVIVEENPLKEEEALVLMGHGTEHEGNEIYHIMQNVFAEKKYPAFTGNVYGTPSFGDAVEGLVRQGARRAKLLPLMFVAGDHAKKDMAGQEGSLLAAVRDAGVLPEPVFRGLGESGSVRALYVERVRETMMKLS